MPIVAAVAGLLLGGVGVAFLALARAQANEGGYFGSPQEEFSTATLALKSDEIDVGAESAHAADPSPDVGELARVRVVVRPRDPSTSLFVGIGHRASVETYLRDVSHEEFVSATQVPFRAAFREVPGTARPADPVEQPFWVATSSGAGTRVLEWDKRRGPWSIVVLRTDGEPGLDVAASIGLRFGFLLPVGVALLCIGLLLCVLAFVRRRMGARPRLG